MINLNRRKEAKPRPLKSPDPDFQNRSMIISTKSPDLKGRPSHHPPQPVQLQLQSLRQDNRLLRRQIQELRVGVPQRTKSSKISENLQISRKDYGKATEGNDFLARELERRRGETARLTADKERKIGRLEKMLKTVQTEGEEEGYSGQRLAEVELENARLKQMLEESASNHFLQEQNISLARRIEQLKGENEAFREMLIMHQEGESERQQKPRSGIIRSNKPQNTVKPQQIYRLKQYFEKQVQLCRDRFYQLAEQLSQAESRVEVAQKELSHLQAHRFSKSKKPLFSTVPSKLKHTEQTPPIARGDSGMIHSNEEEPEVSRFEPVEESRVSKDLQKMGQILKDKDKQISALKNRVRVLDERANIFQEKAEQSRMSTSKDQIIEDLKREIRELKRLNEQKSPHQQSVATAADTSELKDYILSLNETISFEQRRIIALQDENEQLRGALQSNFGDLIAKTNQQRSFLEQQNSELKLQIEKLLQHTHATSSKLTLSGFHDPSQKLSALNGEIFSLKQTIANLKRTNRQVQMEFQGRKMELSQRFNNISEQNQYYKSTNTQLKAQNELLQRSLQDNERELRILMGKFSDYERGDISAASVFAGEREKILESMVRLETENRELRMEMGNLDKLKEENRVLRKKNQRKTEQLEELMEQLSRTKELLQSTSIEEVESRVKQVYTIQKEKFRNRERVIKISLNQKQSLKRENSILSKKVVSLSQEIIRLGHENEALKSEIDRVVQDRQTANRKTLELSQVIQQYLATNKEEKLFQTIEEKATEQDIRQKLQELERPMDLSNLKVSIKRMDQSIQRVRNQLQSFAEFS